jgi:hypothetical protein
MVDNRLALLAVGNGRYCIGHFDPFVDIRTVSPVTPVVMPFPEGYVSVDGHEITSESRALDAALYAGMLRDVFNEPVQLTIRGRARRGSCFTFELDEMQFDVRGVQIEIDGGYEGQRGIYLVEAKIGSPGNVSIRQVLYPLLSWRTLAAAAANDIGASSAKPVRSYVFLYDEPLYRFIPLAYDGHKVAADSDREKAFEFSEKRALELSSIVADPTRRYIDTNVPYPQANDIDGLMDMLTLLGASEARTKWELFSEFGMDIRQIDYYANVLRWMKLCFVDHLGHGTEVKLTAEGNRIRVMSRISRLQEMARIIFSDPIANAVLHGASDMVHSELWDALPRPLNDTTRRRRISGLESWVRYFRQVEAEQVRCLDATSAR